MTVRHYTGETGYTTDYELVHEFLHRISHSEARIGLLEWVFWEWQTARDVYRAEELARMGLWFEDGRLVAATSYEDNVNAVALCTDSGHRHLRAEMMEHAINNMAKDGAVRLIVDDCDDDLQRMAYARGFRPTQDKVQNARLDITDAATAYSLPDGYRVVGLDEEFDVRKYNRCMWFGFNHGPEAAPDDEESLQWRINCVSSPHGNRHLMTVVVAPDGEYAAHCTMWYKGGENAIVEPVATQPNYRKLGLGRAAVLEAARRCGQLGAKRAFVGSSQQFYYNIGFVPVVNETFWVLRTGAQEGGKT